MAREADTSGGNNLAEDFVEVPEHFVAKLSQAHTRAAMIAAGATSQDRAPQFGG
jgi:hypothetical protein